MYLYLGPWVGVAAIYPASGTDITMQMGTHNATPRFQSKVMSDTQI